MGPAVVKYHITGQQRGCWGRNSTPRFSMLSPLRCSTQERATWCIWGGTTPGTSVCCSSGKLLCRTGPMGPGEHSVEHDPAA